MKTARKKYVNISKMSSDEICALLETVDSECEEDIDNVLNDSDTEFKAEDNLVSDDQPKDDSFCLIPDANVHEMPTCSNASIEKSFEWTWRKKETPVKRNTCNLSGTVLLDVNENSTPYDVYIKTLDWASLKTLIADQTNLYAQQNGREFVTNEEEINAFIGINFIMAINKLPCISDYWSTNAMTGNESIKQAMTRERFKTILQNLHFSDNEKKQEPTDRAAKIRPIIEHLNSSFQAAMEDTGHQSIDEHMCKYKGRSSMKQYIKSKPIKWGFKLWFRCCSQTGYLFQFDIYVGRKNSTESSLGEGVVLQLSEKLNGTFCNLYFDNFFTSPELVRTLYANGIYSIGTVRSNRKHMPRNQMKVSQAWSFTSSLLISCKRCLNVAF